MNNEMKSLATLKEAISTGVRRPFFHVREMTNNRIVSDVLFLFLFFFQRPERGERLMNDCFPVAYVFSALRNRISHPTRTGIL